MVRTFLIPLEHDRGIFQPISWALFMGAPNWDLSCWALSNDFTIPLVIINKDQMQQRGRFEEHLFSIIGAKVFDDQRNSEVIA